jgi:hypothetical protein
MPERVVEYPSVYDLPPELREQISEWEDQNLGPDGMHACEYESELSAAMGTKIGGYIDWIQDPCQPACQCGRPMEHLLTVASWEWDGIIHPRWTPIEEQEIFVSLPVSSDRWDDEGNSIRRALRNPTGIMLGDAGQMQLFVCRHCGEWPIVPNIECS